MLCKCLFAASTAEPIQRHFIQRQLHQPQAHLIDGEIMKAAVLAETDQTATRVYPVSYFCVLLWKNEILLPPLSMAMQK